MKTIIHGDLTLGEFEIVDDVRAVHGNVTLGTGAEIHGVNLVRGDVLLGIGAQAVDLHILWGGIEDAGSFTEFDVFKADNIDIGGTWPVGHVTNFQGGTANLTASGGIFLIDKAAGAEINVGGHEDRVVVQSGNVEYTVGGTFNIIEDGRGNSLFFVEDAIAAIRDGAGNDTVHVDAESICFITSGDGRDVYVIADGAEGAVSNFDPGSDTIIFDGQEIEVVADGFIDPGMLFFVDVDETLI